MSIFKKVANMEILGQKMPKNDISRNPPGNNRQLASKRCSTASLTVRWTMYPFYMNYVEHCLTLSSTLAINVFRTNIAVLCCSQDGVYKHTGPAIMTGSYPGQLACPQAHPSVYTTLVGSTKWPHRRPDHTLTVRHGSSCFNTLGFIVKWPTLCNLPFEYIS